MKLKTLGNLGEEFATNVLLGKGYQIIQRNFSCKFGEIDIIATKDKEVYFVEVKTRQSVEFGYPSEAVSKKKMKAIELTAAYFLERSKYRNCNYHFKVFEIYLNEFDQVAI